MLTGTKLMYLRMMYGKTQLDISKQVGCTREYISLVENARKPMTEDMYEKIITAIHSKKTIPIIENSEDKTDIVETVKTPTTTKKATTTKAKG